MKLTDHEAEWQILNSLLFDNGCLDELGLEVSDFDDADSRAIFAVASRLINQGVKANTDSVSSALRDGKAEKTASVVLTLEAWTAGNVLYYARKVRDMSRKRKIVSLMRDVKGSLDDQTTGSDEIIGQIEVALTALSGPGAEGIRSIGEILIPSVRIIEERVVNRGDPTGILTGFRELDAATGGFQPGQLIVIGARPSVGKTALALTMALNMARASVPVGFMSAEMSGEQLVVRAIGGVGSVNTMSMMNGYLSKGDFPKVMAAGETIQPLPIWIDDTPNVSISVLLSRVRKMKRLGARIVFVDYLTLLRHGDPRMPRHERVGEISKMLKGLARELKIPVVALSQVGRQSADAPPGLQDLRQSGEVEEDADVVILLHRKDTETAEKTQTIRAEVAKNRTGPTEVFHLSFLREFVRFENQIAKAGS
jgi:replicative DNA helicase